MAKLGISTGAVPDDGTGSSLLVGAARVNSNFDELYTLLGAGSTTNLAPGIVTSIVGGDNISVSGSGQVTITGSASTAFVNAASLNVAGISTFGGSVTATTFTGALTGNADTATNATNATNVTVADESSDTTCFPLFVTTNTGTIPPKVGSNLTFNSGTGLLSATNVSTSGSVTAATFYGNGANLTGVGGGSTAFVNAATLNVAGVSTFAGVTTFSSPVTLTDNTSLNIGDAPQNLRITHTGAGNKIQTYQGGVIEIGGSADDGSNYEYGLRYTADEAIELTFNGAKKFETTNQGTLTTGISSATGFNGHGNDFVTSQWAVGNSGSSHYTFTGPGNLSAAEDPTIYLARGQTYEFVLNASGHPFRIQTTSGAYDAGTQYETGVTNPGAAVGTIKFQIPFNAPNTLYYVCQNHSAMAGTLTIYPSI